MLQIAALCVTGALMAVVVRRGSPELAMLLALGAVTAVLLVLSGILRELLNVFKSLNERSGIAGTLFLPLYKTIGVAMVVQVGAGLCRDAGESALASAVESAGAVCALLVALPLVQAVLTMLLEMIT